MRTICALLCVVTAGCSEVKSPHEAEIDRTEEVWIDRTYVVAACSETPSPPCRYTSAASNTVFIDSGLVTFTRGDRAARWTMWMRQRWNPCYGGGDCNAPPTQFFSTDDKSATYVVGDTAIALSFGGDLAPVTLVAGAIPARVSSSWPGPDSLYFTQAYAPWKVILRPR
jgi:hypothetical protein